MDRFMSKEEVCEAVCLSKTEIDRREEQGRFPKRTRLGEHRNSRVVWRESAIEKWMDEQVPPSQ